MERLRIERLVAGGFGLARTDEGAVLVRGALPGELVTARPVRSKGALLAHAIEILEPHPQRVTLGLPPGADLPLAYPAQLPLKEELVAEAIERVGKLSITLEPIAASPRELGYRTAAQYAVGDTGLGGRAAGSDAFVGLADDLLACEPIREAFRVLSQRSLHGIEGVSFRASLLEGRTLVALTGDRRAAEHHARIVAPHVAGVVWSQPRAGARFRSRGEVLEGVEELREDFGGVEATVTARSFAQVNPLAAAELYREAARIAGSGETALEVYSGSGVLAFHLAATFARVHALEISEDAVKRGRADARRLRKDVEFHRGDARAVARLLPADLVAVDPPRAGLGDDVMRVLLGAAPSKILYVSCDPATWARDVGRLVSQGYRVTFARPYDFYPYTHHVEVLSLLER